MLNKHLRRAKARQKSSRNKCFNPAGASEFPRRPRFRPSEKHCAAQAEYGRLAAQAYSPSDAMSQARFCLGRMKKVQRRPNQLAGQFAR